MKKIFKKTGKYLLNANIAILGIGVFQYLVGDELFKRNLEITPEKKELLESKNITYQYYKNKFALEESTDSEINRNQHISKMKEENYDILVIGGGSAGAGVLLNAYSRGLKCALIEENDFGSGTSSKSSKLVFGGLRYFQKAFDFNWNVTYHERMDSLFEVRECIVERNFFLNSASFMNELTEFRIKTQSIFDLFFYYYGIFLYECFYYATTNPFKHRIPFPKLDIFNKNISIKEGVFNDTRQALLSILTCSSPNYISNAKPASIANYLQFKNYVYDENKNICGVNAIDKINNKEIKIKAKIVVNSTGVNLDKNFSKEGDLKNKFIKFIKGTHLVFEDLNIPHAIMIPKTSDGRSLTIVPFDKKYSIVGTSEEPLQELKEALPNKRDEDYIIRELSILFKNEKIPEKEVEFTEETLKKKLTSQWSGLIGILEEIKSQNYGIIIRSPYPNILWDDTTNLYNIFGASWTSYREAGRHLVDFIIRNEPQLEYSKEIDKNRSINLRLRGSTDNINSKITKQEYFLEKIFFKSLVDDLKKDFNLSQEVLEPLVKRHGVYAIKILVDGEKTNKNKILFDNFLESEVRFLIKNEMAYKPNDILCRRLNIGFLDNKKLIEAIPIVSEIIKSELKLSDSQIKVMVEESIKNIDSKL